MGCRRRFQRGARALEARQAGAEGGDSVPGTCRGGLGGGVGSSQVRGLHRCVKPRVVAGCPVQRAARVHLLLWRVHRCMRCALCAA